jgi:hypothetical protein
VEVGDLVMLSAYGKKISVNRKVDGNVGLVLEVQSGGVGSSNFFDVYKVWWSGGGGIMWHIRKDLKRAKKTS